MFFSLRAANVGCTGSHVMRVSCVGVVPSNDRVDHAVHVGPRVPVPPRTATIRRVAGRSITGYPAFHRITRAVTGRVRKYSVTNCGSGGFSIPVLIRRFVHSKIRVGFSGHGFVSMRIVFRGVRRHALSTTCGFCYNGVLSNTRDTSTSAHTACRILGTRLSHCPRLPGSVTRLTGFASCGHGISFTKHVICGSGSIRMFGFKGCGKVPIRRMFTASPNCCN